jgi:hypothetical protein
MSLHCKLNIILVSLVVLAITYFGVKVMWPDNLKKLDTLPAAAYYPPDPNATAIPEAPPTDQLFEHHEQHND